MARGIHNLGRKRSEGFKRRVRAGVARAQAEGRPFGAPRTRLTEIGKCEQCGKVFRWTRGKAGKIPHMRTGRFCTKTCLVKWLHKYRQILPDGETLRRHYWDEGMSLWAIAKLYGVESHKSVSAAMEKAGIPRREKRNVAMKSCVVEGCGKPVHKIQHKGNGSWYGKRCREHWNQHRNSLQKAYLETNEAQRKRRDGYMKTYRTKRANEQQRMAAKQVAA